MKILGREIRLFGSSAAKPKKTDVMEYPTGNTSQGFSSYQGISSTQSLSYDLIDSLYQKTIMNRIIQKIAGDATRMNYSVSCIGLDGKRDEKIEEMLSLVDVRLTRSVLRSVIRDSVKYGTSFLFLQYGPENIPINMYTLNGRYLQPVIENGALIKWKYMSQGKEIELELEELLHFPLDPATGEIFGNSIFGPVIQTLELILNSQLNTSILIDRYAIPFFQWIIKKGEGQPFAEPSEINEFMSYMISQASVGSDIGTNEGTEVKVLGADTNLIDFVPIIENLMYTFGVTVGVPLQLIGMRGDNLSVTTRQMQSYLEYVRDIQETIGDILIEKLYKPYLEKQGILIGEDYQTIMLNFPPQTVEEYSKAIAWLSPAINLGLISREEARNTLGFKGPALDIEDVEVPNQQVEVSRPGAKGPNEPKSNPKAPEPEEKDRDHDPNASKRKDTSPGEKNR